MTTLLNGWTKAKIMARITKLNKGKCFRKNSGSDNDWCMYRGPKKNCCLIGALIPDRLYKKQMENKVASEVMRLYPELAARLPFSDADADAFQKLHDKVSSGIKKKELHAQVKDWLDQNFQDAK